MYARLDDEYDVVSNPHSACAAESCEDNVVSNLVVVPPEAADVQSDFFSATAMTFFQCSGQHPAIPRLWGVAAKPQAGRAPSHP